MPISKGSLSCRLYRAQDDLPPDYEERFPRQLRRHWFHEIDSRRGEDRSTGWVNLRHLLDTEPNWDEMCLYPWLLLGLRRDRKSLNPALLRARIELKIEEICKEKSVERIGKQERKAVTEQVKMDMLVEQTPSTQIIEAAWNLQSGLVVFGAASENAGLIFSDLFTETFQVELWPMLPFTLAEKWTEGQGKPELLELLRPTIFSSLYDQLAQEAVTQNADLLHEE
ncbi:recombination-associated protein RdgC [Candidatus Sumerlaeota bacterium]|nr:recombination-associated protein RdgC [Candidatus Sumerlaeota bacterium]